MLFLRHPAWLWLKKHQPQRLPEADANLQDIFASGHQFEAYAEQLFLGAVKLGFAGYDQYLSLPEKTQALIDQHTPCILQGRLEVDGLTCIFDVLERVDEQTFNLIEIKSSTKAKNVHLYDLAFQSLILERLGWQVGEISVLHANKDYLRQGAIDPEQLCSRSEVTQEVKALLPQTKDLVELAKTVLKQPEPPSFSPSLVNMAGVKETNWLKEWLAIYLQELHPDLNKYNIYQLAGAKAEQLGKLEKQGIQLLADIPDELTLGTKQKLQIQTTRTAQPLINQLAVKDFLASLHYPLYFLDYETMTSVIPFFDGMRPYQDYPFQYSLHLLREPASKLEHFAYLHQDKSNPLPGLIAQLKQDLAEQGSILTWNMSYEKGCHQRLADFCPEKAEFFEQVNERIVDLMTVFKNLDFVDRDFMGSASLKNVLPVLVPELSYADLNVSDGMFARRLWTDTILLGKNKREKEAILQDLLDYCTLDTYGMVRILELLERVVEVEKAEGVEKMKKVESATHTPDM